PQGLGCQRRTCSGGSSASRSRWENAARKERRWGPDEGKRRARPPGRRADGAGLWDHQAGRYRTSTGVPWAPPGPLASRPVRGGRWAPPERRGTRSAPGGPPAASRASLGSTNWATAAAAAERRSHTRSRTRTSSVNLPARRSQPTSDDHRPRMGPNRSQFPVCREERRTFFSVPREAKRRSLLRERERRLPSGSSCSISAQLSKRNGSPRPTAVNATFQFPGNERS
ncbi:unnamed protein product, partial [Tetraodon nigroviridis]